MRSMPLYKLCLFTLFLLSQTLVFAQLRIVKDHLACAYGLKNSTDQWILPAQYVSISKTKYGKFIVSDGAKYGLFSAEGKQILPVEYDNIDDQSLAYSFNDMLFSTRKNKLLGVLDATGKEIIPHEYNQIIRQRDHLIMYKFKGDSTYSSYADISGKIYYRDISGFLQFADTTSFTYITKKRGRLHGRSSYKMDEDTKYGLVDTNGKIVIPCIYDLIIRCGKNFIVKKGGMSGVLDSGYNFLLEPKYIIQNNYSNINFCFYPEETYITIDQENKYRFMKGNLNISKPVYERILALPSSQQTQKSVFSIVLNGKTGMADADGNTTIEPFYEDLIPFTCYVRGQEEHKENQYIFKKNGRYGLLNPAGEVLIEPKYNYQEWEGRCFLTSGTELFELNYRQQETELVKIPLRFQNDSLFVFSYESIFLTFHTSKQNPGFLYFSNNTSIQQRGKLFAMNFPSLQYTVLFDFKGKKLDYKITKFYQPDQDFLIFSCEKEGQKMGMLSLNTGKLLIDTIHSSIVANVSSKKYKIKTIWINQSDKWLLVDTLGKPRVNELFDAVPTSLDSMQARVNGLQGILNINAKWMIPPIYKEILKIYNDVYVVITRGNRIGLVNYHNEIIADTIYDFFQPISLEGSHWWILKNNTSRLLINGNCKKLASNDPNDKQAKEIDRLLVDFAFQNGTGDVRYWYGIFKIGVLGQKKQWLNNISFKKEMYTVLSQEYEKRIPLYTKRMAELNQLTEGFKMYANEKKELQPFGLLDFGWRYMSVYQSADLPSERYTRHNPITGNYIWKDNELKPVSISDIFGTGDLLEKLLTLRLPTYGMLHLACSSPALMVQEIGENFSLTENGVLLYLLSTDHRYVSLMIPVEMLKLHPESSWIAPFLSFVR